MRQLLKVDEDGFLLFGQEIFIGLEEEFPESYVDTPLPTNEDGHQLPFYRPKWTGEAWTEGVSQEELEEILKPKPRPLSDTEILGQQMTEREIESMIQGQQITDIELRMLGWELSRNV